MNGVGAMKAAFGGAHMWYQGTVADVSAEQANRVPPGVAHPISALMAHILHDEDFMLNTAVQGKKTLWEQDGWSAKVGGEMMVELDAAKSKVYKCDPKAMSEYARAVFASTDAFLSSLNDKDLERELNLTPFGFPNNMSLGTFLTTMLLGNTYAHTGEISCLKGLLGAKGYPF